MTTSTDYPQGDQMTETPTAAPCTDEQRAEWSDLHDRIRELDKTRERADQMAAHCLRAHVAAGGMAPGEFGIPSEEALREYRAACQYAQEAVRAWEARTVLYDEAQAHPYTAEVNARRAAQE